MKLRVSIVTLSALFIAACSGSAANGSDAAEGGGTPSAPVAAAAAPKGKSWVDTVRATPEGGFVMGNPNAPLKLIEFGSRLCPFCGEFDRTGLPQLKAKYIATGKVSYEFRDYPIHGAPDLAPILLGHCTDDPATFFPILDQMMQAQADILPREEAAIRKVQALGNPSPTQIATAYAEGLGLIDFMKQRGLPEAKARACLTSQARIDTIAQRTKAANDKYQVQSTPTFILNGEVLSSIDTWQKLEALLKQRGA